MHVPDRFGQVLVGRDRFGPEAAAEQRAIEAVTGIESLRIAGPEMVHRRRQVSLRAVDDEVVVVAHEAVRVDVQGVATMHVVEDPEKCGPIPVVAEDRLLAGTAVHHVMPGAGGVLS